MWERKENMSENHLVMLCVVPDRGSGERIARALVQERLAGCVNLVPGVVSTFRWEGEVKQEDELLMIIKTAAGRFEAVRAAITMTHPYDTPEVIALPIIEGDARYLTWLVESSK
jgi:periplasmic divalent cation tolerance protein